MKCGGLSTRTPSCLQPQDVFSIDSFRASKEAQMAFYDVARELLTSGAEPTVAHCFLKLLEDKGLLKRLYTQNIDMLEKYVTGHDGRW